MTDPKTRRPLVPEYVAQLRAYEPGMTHDEIKERFGLDRVVKLASNESPLGPSPAAIQAIQASAAQVHRYPRSNRSQLLEDLAKRFNVKTSNLVLGAGSESIMACIIRAFLLDDDEAITSEGTFLGFNVVASSRGIHVHRIPISEGFRFDLQALAAAINEHTKIIYVANPNNPTGTYANREEFETFMDQVPDHVLVIWDEAYFEYAQDIPDFPDSMQYRLDNVITLRTFSKAYALAGVRLGFGIAHEELISNIRKVRLPFEPSIPALMAGVAALQDQKHLETSLELNREQMPKLCSELKDLGFHPIPSAANFVMVPCVSSEYVQTLVETLLSEGVIVRALGPFGFPKAFRITVGTREENELLFEKLRTFVQSPNGRPQ